MKKSYFFDELTEAENILEKGFTNGIINYNAVSIVAKYFREVKGYGAIKLERELIKFCKSQNSEFNPITERNTIKNWIKNSMQCNLRKIDSIKITHSEMDVIKTIEDLRKRKILFVTLAMAKAIKLGKVRKNQPSGADNRKYYIPYSMFPEITKRLEVRISDIELADIYNEFINMGLLKLYNAERESILITFTDDTSPIAVDIKKDKITEYYTAFFGGDVYHCSNCGEEYIRKSNVQRMCESCAKVAQRDKKKRWKRRNVKKVDQ